MYNSTKTMTPLPLLAQMFTKYNCAIVNQPFWDLDIFKQEENDRKRHKISPVLHTGPVTALICCS